MVACNVDKVTYLISNDEKSFAEAEEHYKRNKSILATVMDNDTYKSITLCLKEMNTNLKENSYVCYNYQTMTRCKLLSLTHQKTEIINATEICSSSHHYIFQNQENNLKSDYPTVTTIICILLGLLLFIALIVIFIQCKYGNCKNIINADRNKQTRTTINENEVFVEAPKDNNNMYEMSNVNDLASGANRDRQENFYEFADEAQVNQRNGLST